ncbi:MAG: type II toxin-antitoxin system VapC family toxin [Castellaniella sp.]|uniref:Type II toxin-antitoxin system VapC family toxin n=1 Tax=Castellaniella hirudinis TaxID=1144617 RepID=A0ABV8RXV8_9BURK
MNFLLDTHVLLWSAGQPEKLTGQARAWLEDDNNVLIFSAASLWEITIKSGLGRDDFQVDPHVLRRGLLDNGYEELRISSQHAVAVAGLPALHKDPFDRLLIAQATLEGITLLTADSQILQYPGPIQSVS